MLYFLIFIINNKKNKQKQNRKMSKKMSNINNVGVETSAGVLLWRRNLVKNNIEVMLVSSYGDPKKLNKRVWNIPKGHIEQGQSLVQTAIRQFQEETGIQLTEQQKGNLDYIGLCCTQKGKHVHIFGLEKDVNGGKQRVNIKSNLCEVPDPKDPTKTIMIPEAVSGKYFDINESLKYIFNYQQVIINRLKGKVK